MKELSAHKLTSGFSTNKTWTYQCVYSCFSNSLPMKMYLWRMWGDIQLQWGAELDQVLSSRLGFYFVCIISHFPKCDHLQFEEFPSVFLVVLWIKPCSFLKEKKKKIMEDSISSICFISQITFNIFFFFGKYTMHIFLLLGS